MYMRTSLRTTGLPTSHEDPAGMLCSVCYVSDGAYFFSSLAYSLIDRDRDCNSFYSASFSLFGSS